ncbi:MAG: hypothetical protein QXJ75_04125 [Candidatus Bathyarchaeia archaeon]
MRRINKIVSLAAVVTFAMVMLGLVGVLSTFRHSILSRSLMPDVLSLWTFRGFDVILLCFLIFVSVVGAAVLFEEKRYATALEEATIEEAKVEEEEEE